MSRRLPPVSPSAHPEHGKESRTLSSCSPAQVHSSSTCRQDILAGTSSASSSSRWKVCPEKASGAQAGGREHFPHGHSNDPLQLGCEAAGAGSVTGPKKTIHQPFYQIALVSHVWCYWVLSGSITCLLRCYGLNTSSIQNFCVEMELDSMILGGPCQIGISYGIKNPDFGHSSILGLCFCSQPSNHKGHLMASSPYIPIWNTSKYSQKKG